jgi:hypothetical protein
VSAKLGTPPIKRVRAPKPRRRWGFFFASRTALSTDPHGLVGPGGASNRRRGRPLLGGRHVPINEPLGVLGKIVVGVKGPLQHLARDVFRYVNRPALGGVEGDYAECVRILAAEEIADHRLAVGFGKIGLDEGAGSSTPRGRGPPSFGDTRNTSYLRSHPSLGIICA